MDDVFTKELIERSLNCEKSRKALEFILKQFELPPDLINGRRMEEWEIYNDNYAGAYFDEEGFLVFCTVNIDTLDVGEYTGQVIHRKCNYSYKYLHTVQMLIADSMMKPYGGISSVGVDLKENLVKVDIKDDSNADSRIEELIGFLGNKDIKQGSVRIQKSKGIYKRC